MALFTVTYEKRLPGWEEFGKSQVASIKVEAPTLQDSFNVAEALLGKYCNPINSIETT